MHENILTGSHKKICTYPVVKMSRVSRKKNAFDDALINYRIMAYVCRVCV